jgi:hypothetical protein
LSAYKKSLLPKPIDWNDDRDGAWPGRKPGQYEWYEIQDNIAYWQEFDLPKIVSTKVSIRPTFALDSAGHYLGNTSYFFVVRQRGHYLLSLLNSSIAAFYAKNTFVGKQGGWYEVQPVALESMPAPAIDDSQDETLCGTLDAFSASSDARLEQLLNAFIYELFFSRELHARKLHFFDVARKAGLGVLAGLKGKALHQSAGEIVERIFASSHPIYSMLFDLQTIDEVRIIEGKE